jgi:hypothetical protein
MFKQLQAIIQPRVVKIKQLDRRIRVLHYRVVKEIKEGVEEGIKKGFKLYVPKDGNIHHTPFTK